MKHKYIDNVTVNEYICRKKRFKRDKQAFEWKLINISTEERQAYKDLLERAEQLFNDIESVLTTEQKRFVDVFFFKNISTLQEVSDELHIGKTTIHRYRLQIIPMIEQRWLEYKWWFDEYMPLDKK